MADNNAESSPQSLSRRGYPVRIRKKNQRFFNDNEETDYSPSKSHKKRQSHSRTPTHHAASTHSSTTATPSSSSSASNYTTPNSKTNLSTSDKRIAQNIGMRLRNLLKLPKAHRWVCYEYFYSNLDIPLFLVENDFNICLKETFPQLKTRNLRKVEWVKIRRLMGKPRRCSSAFFTEEREALEQRRSRIRLLQQRKLGELTSLKDLPDEVPMQLVIGTQVTARLRKPQDGLFTGTIEAVDTAANTYRITFHRQGLGTHSVPDIEVLSNERHQTLPLSSFQQTNRPRAGGGLFSPPRFIPGCGVPMTQLDNDPLLSGSPFKGRLMSLEGGTYGGFPIKFLVLVTRLSKILDVKKDWVQQLSDMNTQAEKKRSYQQPITVEFQKKYANIVLELERLNKDLNEYLEGVQDYCNELAPEQGLPPVEMPNDIKNKCEIESEAMVDFLGQSMMASRKKDKNDSVIQLIIKLTSLMLQVKTFSTNEFNSFECKSLQESLKSIKETLDLNNITTFENNVEIHTNHIQSGLSQMGNLHSFSAKIIS